MSNELKSYLYKCPFHCIAKGIARLGFYYFIRGGLK